MPCRPASACPTGWCQGTGFVPLGWVIGQFAAAGYRGFFDVELLGPRIAAEGARQAMTRGVRHVSALLQASYPVEADSGTDRRGELR